MYQVSVTVRGIVPLLQHRYPMPEFDTLSSGGKKSTGSVDYSEEWKNYFYQTSDGDIYQPSEHFERALTKAGASFKITGKRGKTYKDLIQTSIVIDPEKILYGVKVPEKLDLDADKPLYLDMRPVIIQRSRVTRLRPTFKKGWELSFEIQCTDDQIPPEMLQEILVYAGKAVGISDYRPKFGRFMVTKFEVLKS